MGRENLSISRIESYLHSIIDNVVSQNTFVGTLPETTDEQWNDMCLIDVSDAIYDLDAYGRGSVFVLLYAKPMGNGTKNVATMNTLETKLEEVISNANNPNYLINKRSVHSEYDSARKWHCNIIELNIVIV